MPLPCHVSVPASGKASWASQPNQSHLFRFPLPHFSCAAERRAHLFQLCQRGCLRLARQTGVQALALGQSHTPFLVGRPPFLPGTLFLQGRWGGKRVLRRGCTGRRGDARPCQCPGTRASRHSCSPGSRPAASTHTTPASRDLPCRTCARLRFLSSRSSSVSAGCTPPVLIAACTSSGALWLASDTNWGCREEWRVG